MGWESGAEPSSRPEQGRPLRRRGDAARRGRVGRVRRPRARRQRRRAAGARELRSHLAGDRTGALLGSSGVGKSTLINAFTGGALRTQDIRSDGRGRHTTTHRELVPPPAGACCSTRPGCASSSSGRPTRVSTRRSTTWPRSPPAAGSRTAATRASRAARSRPRRWRIARAGQWESYGKLQRGSTASRSSSMTRPGRGAEAAPHVCAQHPPATAPGPAMSVYAATPESHRQAADAMRLWTPGSAARRRGCRRAADDAALGGGAGRATVVGEAFHVFPNGAVTGVLLWPSRISASTWPELGLASVDLHSYGHVDGERVMAVVRRLLGAERTTLTCIERGCE